MPSVTVGDDYTSPRFASSALLLIDIQVDFLDGGAAAIPGTTDRLPELQQLVHAYRVSRRPIVHVVRLYTGDDVDLVRRAAIQAGAAVVRPGTAGAGIAPTLLPDPAIRLDTAPLLAGELQQLGAHEAVLWKPRWSAFYRTRLDHHLRDLGVDTVVVAGCNFPNCPRATIFDASERDYRIVLVDDATSQLSPERLSDATALGAWTASTQSVIQALSQRRRHQQLYRHQQL